jgi:tRNA pseudouridine38-40 synthase
LIDAREVQVHGAGRTDAGVHALAQVANVQLERAISPEKLCAAINGNIGRDVRVTQVEVVPDDFHARFSARGKTYCYSVFNAPFMSPFWLRYAYHEARAIDVDQMRRAALLFLGEHDWTAFSAAQSDVATRVRTITKLEIQQRRSERFEGVAIHIVVCANGFLRYMVRSIAGTLLEVGRGEMEIETIKSAIKEGARSLVGATAPSHGLTLVKVHYD